MKNKTGTRSRKIRKYLCVDELEDSLIRQRMKESGIKNYSRYARLMLINGQVNKVNTEEIKQAVLAMVRLGNNLNQIAKKANEEDRATNQDLRQARIIFEEIKEIIEKALKEKLQTDDISSFEKTVYQKNNRLTASEIIDQKLNKNK